MTYTIERTDKEIIIKLPINATSEYIQRFLEQQLEARKTIKQIQELQNKLKNN